MFRIIPEQGEVVKEIYSRYLAGESAYIIAKTLAERGVTGQMGKPIEQTTVKEILSSMSYTGTMILQKNYMTEGHIRKRNKGELPMYLVDEMFEPLVSEEDYQRALEIRQQRAELFPNNQNNLTAFSGKVKCGYCGCGISRRTSGSRKRWVCNTRERKGMKSCECRPIWETELTEATKTVLGGSSDESAFSKEIQQVTLYTDRIEFSLQNGNRKSIIRQFSGQRGQNAFRKKILCGSCGCKCKRNNYGKKKVWCCSQPRTVCRMKRLPENEILEAAERLLGENFQVKVAADIGRILVFDDTVNFEFKNGTVKKWQRK